MIVNEKNGNAVNTFAERLCSALADQKIIKNPGNPNSGVHIGKAAEFLGIARNTLADYLKGKFKPPTDKVKLMAEKLGVSEVWLSTGFGSKQAMFAHVELIEASYDDTKPSEASKKGVLPILIKHDDCKKELFAIAVTNNTLRPAFPPGTYLVFDANKAPEDKGIAFIKNDTTGEYYIKQTLLDKQIYIKNLNDDDNTKKALSSDESIWGVFIEANYSDAKF